MMAPRAAAVGAGASLAALLVLWCLGCGTPSDEATPSAAELTLQGWSGFEAGDYAGAQAKFLAATQKDAGYGEAYNGYGWATMNLESYAEALAAFETAVSRGVITADPLVGQALLHRDLDGGDPARVISAANAALARSPEYSFAHDRRLDWRDVRLLLAQAYFQHGEYLAANDQVALVGGVAQDSQSADFVRDLLAEIERLGKLLGG